jgi:alkanesulfonate monooxygenase SsuD/methylene tetrahydromethanopterin reductase-like flavin-dependent oxidoreductase (luciferase family)
VDEARDDARSSLASLFVKIGVELRLGRDGGETFADARAFEAAAVDSLWVFEHEDTDHTLLAAAIAAVTSRVRIVWVKGSAPAAIKTLERLSRGRLAIAEGDGERYEVTGADAEPERWVRVDFPKDRAAWRETRAKHEADGVAGLVVSNDPRLLDLLRNPDAEDDRQDLKLAFG